MSSANEIRIVPARTAQHIADARDLCREYLDWLLVDHGIRLDFQGVEDEIRDLPGKYSPPVGELLVAYGPQERALGCIAVRPFDIDVCEIKRLYIRPEARGSSLGRRLAEAIMAEARSLGYSRAVLDTAGFMRSAERLYRAVGFHEIPPYYDNPIPGVKYLAAEL